MTCFRVVFPLLCRLEKVYNLVKETVPKKPAGPSGAPGLGLGTGVAVTAGPLPLPRTSATGLSSGKAPALVTQGFCAQGCRVPGP